ncbi:MAG: hypothetical protein AB7N76_06470 [Planctomycetota bacterium]
MRRARRVRLAGVALLALGALAASGRLLLDDAQSTGSGEAAAAPGSGRRGAAAARAVAADRAGARGPLVAVGAHEGAARGATRHGATGAIATDEDEVAPEAVSEAGGEVAPRREQRPVEPTPEAIAACERALAAGDAEALLTLATRERSLVRYEALRGFCELAGPAGLSRLAPLWAQDDPALHELLADACGAGGDAELGVALAADLQRDPLPGRRLQRARALCELGARVTLPTWIARAATEALVSLARSDDDAVAALRDHPDELAALANDAALAADLRLHAAELLLGGTAAERARAPLAALAAGPAGPVQRLAATRLESLGG